MKNAKAIVALALTLMLLLPALAQAEADVARFEELVAANSMKARFERHHNMRVIRTHYFEDGISQTETHLMDSGSYYDILPDGFSDYITPDLHLTIDPNYDDRIAEYLYDSEEASYDNYYYSVEAWSLSTPGEELSETAEADGVYTARTVITDPFLVFSMLGRLEYIPEWLDFENGMMYACDYTFEAGTGDLLKIVGSLVDGKNQAFVFVVVEFAYDVEGFDPAAGDSPFAGYYTAPDGECALTLHFVSDGTEMKYSIPHGIGFGVVHDDSFARVFLDEACTQPYGGGNQLDELTLYVE